MLKHIENQKDYDKYKARVASFLEREGIDCLSIKQLPDGEYSESYFSFSNCECCGRPLGGDRYLCSGYQPESNNIFDYEICDDCLYYAEYGQLDDMTMMDYDLE